MDQNWYKNTTWNKEISLDFENRLSKIKNNFNKAQYLRIQAYYLLQNPDVGIQEKGIAFMDRICKNFPDDSMNIMNSHLNLGDYFLKRNMLYEAEYHYQIVFNHNFNNANKYGHPELFLAQVYLKSNEKKKLEQAYSLTINFNFSRLFLDIEKFYYYRLYALIAHKLEHQKEAINAAKKALEILLNTKDSKEINMEENVSLLKNIIYSY